LFLQEIVFLSAGLSQPGYPCRAGFPGLNNGK